MFQKPKHSQGFAVLPQVHKPHIKKDKPTGAMVRRKEYVDENVAIMQGREAPDRHDSGISVYGRGRNPWGEFGQPYKVAKDGAFRAPIIRPTDLLPLSRPRRETISISNRYRAPTNQMDASEGIDVKMVNPGNKVSTTAHTQISRPLDDRTQNSQVTLKEKDMAQASAMTNVSDPSRYTPTQVSSITGMTRDALNYTVTTNMGVSPVVGNAQPTHGANYHKTPLYTSANRPAPNIKINFLNPPSCDAQSRTPLHASVMNRPSGGVDVSNANTPHVELVRRVLPVNTTTAISRSDIVTSHQGGCNVKLASKPSISVIAAPTQNINVRDNTRYELDDTLPIQSFTYGRSGGYHPRTLENPTPSFNFQRLKANMPNHYINPENQNWTVPNTMVARPEDHRMENFSAMQRSPYINQNMLARQTCPYARLSAQA